MSERVLEVVPGGGHGNRIFSLKNKMNLIVISLPIDLIVYLATVWRSPFAHCLEVV